jgi:hypothetical protein
MIRIFSRHSGDCLYEIKLPEKWIDETTTWKLGFAMLHALDREVDLTGADLCGVDLGYAEVSDTALLKNALAPRIVGFGVKFTGIYLCHAKLNDVNLGGANLRSVNLDCAKLRGAILSHADLRNSNLAGADLTEATLKSADLSHTMLRDAKLCRADLSYADLSFARFYNVDLKDANLNQVKRNDGG